jgi:diacylglycerol kinase (ATP)
MANPQNTGLRRIVNATWFSMAGLRAAWVNEAAFRQEATAGLILIPFGIWLGQNAVERALLIGSCLLVIVVELLNSGIEAAVDRVSMDKHHLAGRAKDLGSAAVFVSIGVVALIWTLIAYERFS